MYKNLLAINEDNIGTVGVFDSEADFRTGGAPIRTYDIVATPEDGQSMYDALVAVMEVTDETNIIPTLTRLQFMSRFTQDELIQIEYMRQYAETPLHRVQLSVLKETWMIAEFVDVTDPRTQQGMELLVQLGLLTEERMHEILI
jgi:hypothetical protein